MNDCERTRAFLPSWADGEEAAWVEEHCAACPVCRAACDRFRALDQRLGALRAGVRPASGRAQFLASVHRLERGRRRMFASVPAAAGLLAAAIVLTTSAPRPESHTGANDFVPVPFVPPLASYEQSSVVSRTIPVVDLLAEGYRISAEPSSTVQADVLLGEDGLVHAVRVRSDDILKGIGD